MASDIITLQNFIERLPGWDPEGACHLFAIVDMGSNGIRFSVTDLAPPHSRLLRCVYRERAAISLFDALSSDTPSPASPSPPFSPGSTGHPAQPALAFPPETIARVAATLARFRRISVSYGVPPHQFSVLATEAVRKASNAAALLAAIREAADVGVHVLAPEVETLFGAVMGTRSSFVSIARGGLVLDLGGGSVQMTWVDTTLSGYEIAAALAGESMPFGAARLTRVLEAEPQEARVAETAKLTKSIQGAFSKLRDKFPALKALSATGTATASHPGVDVYLCGGGFRGYGSMLMHNDPIQPYPLQSVGSYTVRGDFFKQTAHMLKVNAEYEGKIAGLSRRRRRQFPAIVAVVDAFVAAVPNIRTVTFCSGSNRDGALLLKLPRPIRESNPLDSLAAVGEKDRPVFDAILGILRAAMPANAGITRSATVFSLGLGYLFVQNVWSRCGEAETTNAAFSLHESVSRDPSAPGLTHLARAVLGLTLFSRWGSTLGPLDAQLHKGLVSLLDANDPDAHFWSRYIGIVVYALATFIPALPKSPQEAMDAVMCEATITKDGKRDKIILTLHVSAEAAQGVDLSDLEDTIDAVGKHNSPKKVTAKIQIG